MKLNAESLKQMKSAKPIPMLTAYTAPVARSLEKAGIPVILVGDTVGMVEMGFDSTRHVTIEHMQYHVGAVRRGAPNTHIIGDLPYDSDRDPATALHNARLLLNAGADSIKLEGPKYDVIAHLVANGIAVVGHTGLTPQTAPDFRQVGGKKSDADRILNEAIGIAAAGAFMVVLEHIPAALAKTITQSIAVPTIGIGAGASCDGQVLVINDAIGLGDYWPPFSRQYAYVGKTIVDVAERFMKEVDDGTFVDQVLRMHGSRKK
ncbi:3-methyl-2-oxobutanoate hydroxymethyltransferase [Methylocaldum marinum]|uniref:3-methyl-2-oxobutanoate hydroxymethyltransferase n=1 Tax=Methylocaldum marinum TaxID=1432792 RepID=A0A250L0T6_9GAMM|nr:3-methyl-2-oxobutanoate hydroxymethyltransferase [Methylocaldum marinum]BBA36861.1 3-methyl-2-oxobutanoate hydroxymethyltransferase [Methylocaldum marinum]